MSGWIQAAMQQNTISHALDESLAKRTFIPCAKKQDTLEKEDATQINCNYYRYHLVISALHLTSRTLNTCIFSFTTYGDQL